jgi:hypothetical protein
MSILNLMFKGITLFRVRFWKALPQKMLPRGHVRGEKIQVGGVVDENEDEDMEGFEST